MCQDIVAYLEGNPALSIVVAYAPTKGEDLEDKSEFWKFTGCSGKYQSTNNCTILIGDFNARIGQDSHTTKPRVIGNNTYHDLTNSNGELLSDFFASSITYAPLSLSFLTIKAELGLGTILQVKENSLITS